MKNLLLLVCVAVSFTVSVLAQAPEKMNYQGVARDNSGNVLPNQNIGLRITLHSGSSGGTTVYQETHDLNTNAFGLFNIEIGGGTVVSGTFSSITWGSNSFYVQVELDPAGGTSYSDMGTSQLISVPYALYAKSSGTSGPTGPTGPTGVGSAGATGATGPTGAANASGTTDYVSKFTGTNTLGNSSIFDNGMVGIGTTSPTAPLHLYGSADPLLLLDGGASDQSVLKFSTAGTGKWGWYVPGGGDNLALWNYQNFSNYTVFDGVSGNISLAPSGGYVGIGSLSPASTLDVATSSSGQVASFSTSADLYIGLYEGGTYKGYLGSFYGGADDIDIGSSTGSVHLVTGGSIDLTANAGRVGIGTTAPIRKLHVIHDQFTGSGGAGGIEIQQTSNSNRWTLYTSQSTSALSLWYNDATRGNFDITTGAYAAVSDKRLKKNIEPLQNMINKIMQLRPTQYHFNEQKDSDSKNFGLIAQEVEEVFPQVVKIMGDDSNGNGIPDIHMVSYTELIPVMIKGMQEQQETIKQLQERIKALEAR